MHAVGCVRSLLTVAVFAPSHPAPLSPPPHSLCGHTSWKNTTSSLDYDYKTLRHLSHELMSARRSADYRALVYHLTTVMNRQFCNIQSEQLYSHAYHGTKYAIEDFYCHVVEQLSFLAKTDFGPEFSTRHKLRFFQRARRTLGKTVLCLSGGGALAMYHAGVVRAMVKGNCLPSILNGTSGGSIIAALVGTRTDAELKDPTFFCPNLCVRFGPEYRWLPTLQQQVEQFIARRVLMDHADFSRSAQIYFGRDLTFEEAYRRTQRVVCITVTWSAQTAGKSHPLVLNHITSPNVFVWSAVCCSCALPGLMQPQNLFAKGPDGRTVEYYPSGSEIIDGSLQADIPVQRLTELFNAQTFIVSQTNPHVIDFVRDGNEGQGFESGPSPFGRGSRTHKILTGLEKFLQADIGHRLKRLAKMKVIPKIYRQDFAHVVSGKQKYSGDINIVPRIPFLMRFKALTHPSVDDMHEYFRGGEAATFPKVSRIQNVLLLERTLEACVRSLTNKIKHDERERRYRRQQKQEQHLYASPVMAAAPAPFQHAATTTTSASTTRGSSDDVIPPTVVLPGQAAVGGGSGSFQTPVRRAHHPTHAVHSLTPRGTVSGIILPESLESASSVSAARRRSRSFSGVGAGVGGDRSDSHHLPASQIQTPTAAVLAHLPLHGAYVTDHDHEAEDSSSSEAVTLRAHINRRGTGGEAGHFSTSSDDRLTPVASHSSSSSHTPVIPDAVDRGSNGVTGLGGGYESDESTTTTASYIDFDAEEMADQELDADEHSTTATPSHSGSVESRTSRHEQQLSPDNEPTPPERTTQGPRTKRRQVPS